MGPKHGQTKKTLSQNVTGARNVAQGEGLGSVPSEICPKAQALIPIWAGADPTLWELYLQLGFALPGAPPDRVEVREFAILLRFPLSSGEGRGREERNMAIRTEATLRSSGDSMWKPSHLGAFVPGGPRAPAHLDKGA